MNGLTSDNKPELDYERVQILYANVAAGYLGVASAIVMLYFIAARYSGFGTAGLWLLAVALLNLPRLAVSLLFSRRMRAGRITARNAAPWDQYMSLSSVLAYTGFVAVIFLPYGDNAVIASVLCAFVFMTLATGGVLVLSTSFPQIVIFLTLVIFSIAARFLMLDDWIFSIVAIILLFGYLQLFKLTRRQSGILLENIALKIENKNSSLIDPLTRLANRRRLSLHTEKLVPAARRSGEPFCVILLDIDHFKQFNDSRGHREGDRLLVRVADTLRGCSRDQDLVVRYGGEEFLVVLPQTHREDAELIAGRILAAVRERTAVTVSAGVAQFSRSLDSFEQLLALADKALYAAKHAGRDRFIVAGTDATPQAKTASATLPGNGAQLQPGTS